MDGTLADVRGIRHYIHVTRNFHLFHSASLFVPPNDWVADAARDGGRNVIVTARDSRYERVTRDWLVKHHIPYERLFMRPWGDGRPDQIIKSEILDQIFDQGFNPIIAYDDNPNVIGLWKSRGIPTVVVPGWDDVEQVSYAEVTH
jgi:hypothetical protein